MSEPGPSADTLDEKSIDGDEEFDLTEENEDDEDTLIEEESLDSGDAEDELNSLQEEGDLPLEILLQRYGYTQTQPTVRSSQDSNSSDSSEGPESKRPRIETQLDESAAQNGPATMAEILMASEDSNESEPDSDYEPPVESNPHREPRIGDEFQCSIPAVTISDETPDYRSESLEECLWSPSVVKNHDELYDFMCKVFGIPLKEKETLHFLHDNDELLGNIFKANGEYDQVEIPESTTFSTDGSEALEFTSEDIDSFEEGLRLYGKDFFNIRKEKLSHKSVPELVNFYYFWKKTRRDDFVSSVGTHEHEVIDTSLTNLMYQITNNLQNGLVDSSNNTIPRTSDILASKLSDSTQEAVNGTMTPPGLEIEHPFDGAFDDSNGRFPAPTPNIAPVTTESRPVQLFNTS